MSISEKRAQQIIREELIAEVILRSDPDEILREGIFDYIPLGSIVSFICRGAQITRDVPGLEGLTKRAIETLTQKLVTAVPFIQENDPITGQPTVFVRAMGNVVQTILTEGECGEMRRLFSPAGCPDLAELVIRAALIETGLEVILADVGRHMGFNQEGFKSFLGTGVAVGEETLVQAILDSAVMSELTQALADFFCETFGADFGMAPGTGEAAESLGDRASRGFSGAIDAVTSGASQLGDNVEGMLGGAGE